MTEEEKKMLTEEQLAILAAQEQQAQEQAASVAGQQQPNTRLNMPALSSNSAGKIESEQAGVTNSVQSGTSNTTGTQHNASVSTQTSESSGRSYREIDYDKANEAADKQIAQRYKDMGYIQDENGNWVEPNLLDALKIREKLRGEREKQMKLNRWKQIESALYNSGAILSDMISAGIGGNVYKRDKDTTAADAAKDTERLRELQAAEDVAAAEKERARRKEQADINQQIRDKNIERFTATVSTNSGTNRGVQQGVSTSSQTTQSTSRSSQSSHTKGQQDPTGKGYSYDKDGNLILGGGGGGSRGAAAINVRITNKDGETIDTISIPKEDKEELVNTAHTLLQEALNKGTISADDLRGIYTPATRKKAASWNDDNILSSEIVLSQPRILNEFINRLIKQGYQIDNQPISRVDAYELITGVNPRDNNGNIVSSRVLQGVILDGVSGTNSSINYDMSQESDFAGLFD